MKQEKVTFSKEAAADVLMSLLLGRSFRDIAVAKDGMECSQNQKWHKLGDTVDSRVSEMKTISKAAAEWAKKEPTWPSVQE